jgi:6-phosphogluconolactonase
VRHDVEILTDPDAVARTAAARLAAWARAAVADAGRCALALSGGHTPAAMLDHLTAEAVPWEHVSVFQVDERVAPEGDPERNATQLRRILGALVEIVAMPVDDPDLDAAAARYARRLPARFDVVHLGLGADGHTASLVPGDAVLDVADRLVATTQPYEGTRRMTLTYPALARANRLLWIVTGAAKRAALARLVGGDTAIPAGRVEAAHSWVLADTAAAP